MEMLSDAPLQAVIPVADLARAKAYYQDTLGLKIVEDNPNEVGFECGGTLFGMYETPYGGKADHTLASFKVSDLDAEMSALRSKGVTFEDYDLPGLKTVDGVMEVEGMRGAWFKDSEGNILCVVQMTGK
ncbi:VOC family protein [Kitasatospora sp. NPDC054939]